MLTLMKMERGPMMGFKQINSMAMCWLVGWTWSVSIGGLIIYAFNNKAIDTLIASIAITLILFIATWVISRVV